MLGTSEEVEQAVAVMQQQLRLLTARDAIRMRFVGEHKRLTDAAHQAHARYEAALAGLVDAQQDVIEFFRSRRSRSPKEQTVVASVLVRNLEQRRSAVLRCQLRAAEAQVDLERSVDEYHGELLGVDVIASRNPHDVTN